MAFVAAISTAGCFAHHAGTPLDLEPVDAPDAPAHLVVGIREPEIALDPPYSEGSKGAPHTSLVELGRAMTLIADLRAAGLYAQVDFEGQLDCEPDVLLVVHENPRLTACDADAPLLLLYGGVIPVWITCDEGHHFSRVDREAVRFAFPWHETMLMGWLPPLLNVFPSWTWGPPGAQKRQETFRAFLLSHGSDLLPESMDREGDRCSAR